MVMANIPFLSTYIKQCVMEKDLEKIFSNDDFSITFPSKSIPVKVGNLQVNARPARALSLMVSPVEKWASSPSFSSVMSATYASSSASTQGSSNHRHSTASPSITTTIPTGQAMLSTIRTQFQQLKNRLDASTTRMDSIESLCCQLKGNTDMIAGQPHLGMCNSSLIQLLG